MRNDVLKANVAGCVRVRVDSVFVYLSYAYQVVS